ncbi:hypothetical protein [Thermophilibacter provencensis]|uniref:DUF5648 domain-containing protein n=1 Tax=Thermophilibacter provencensis TaxID=1852386 RepID=A0ABT7V1I9_9ACTN|nr:hypothetical protein [Thermophilibacter provencensis]MDM8270463.1 hypothetical protein [Thermophilibacter provencensis]
MRKHLFVAAAGLALALALVPGVAGAREIKTTLAEDWPNRVVEIPDSWTITDEQVAEWEASVSDSFNPEASACYAAEGKSWILYRLYNPYTDDHHYTSDKDEYAELKKVGWVGEGIVFYSGNLYGIPVYRLYNPYVSHAYHHFTQDKDEVEALVEAGWVNEGVAWFYTNQKGA